jgi:hypothetical protein
VRPLFFVLGIALSTIGACHSHSEPIGVAACDAYVAKLERCATQLGGRRGDSLRRFSKMMADGWQARAAGTGRSELAASCAQATADARRQNPPCAW